MTRMRVLAALNTAILVAGCGGVQPSSAPGLPSPTPSASVAGAVDDQLAGDAFAYVSGRS